ncbi:MAG: hypothetical protein HY360_17870 [Verrucomicrobia bacterium]|nr:hypothetical protein [Verrucomicrobiota bacterium]
MNLRDELRQLVRALDSVNIPYALCWGLAMAVHGWPRATLDIDLLVEAGHLEGVRRLAGSLGFTHEAGEMTLAAGRVRLFRMVKFVGQEWLPLDLLIVTPDLLPVWKSRRQAPTGDGPITVVSPAGMIQMKSLRNSGTDQDDIRRLKGESDEDG